MRENTSGFALASPNMFKKALYKLRKDLNSGEWDTKIWFPEKTRLFDAGFRFTGFTK